MLAALLVSLVAAWRSDVTMLVNDNAIKGASALAALFFGATMLSKKLQTILASKALLFAGAISYPLYLIHENAMVSMIGSVGRAAPWVPSLLLPVLPIAVLSLVAWLIATKAEPALRSLLRRPFVVTKPA